MSLRVEWKRLGVKRVLMVLCALILLAVAASLVYWESTEYKPQQSASAAYDVAARRDGWYEFGSGETGVILYPGLHVDRRAYADAARELARESGAVVAVVEAPLDVAVLDQGAATDVMVAHPEVERWIVGGHSLGGMTAARYANADPEGVDGLLLWASYPLWETDLRGDGIPVAAVYGPRDDVLKTIFDLDYDEDLDLREIDAEKELLPRSTRYARIEGMNHAQFGDYGPQSGDGKPGIPRGRAVEEAVDASASFVHSLRKEETTGRSRSPVD